MEPPTFRCNTFASWYGYIGGCHQYFSIEHTQVIDEADRLLTQSFQDWLAQVLTAIRWRPSQSIFPESKLSLEDTCLPPDCDSLAPACLDLDYHGYCQVDIGERRRFSCQKLLFSATLTRDPGKLASLGLRDPKYFVVQSQTEGGSDCAPSHLVSERFAMPTTLTVSLEPTCRLFWVKLCTLGAYGCLRAIAKTAHVASPSPQL